MSTIMGRCKTCRFALTDEHGDMECHKISRCFSILEPENGSAYAVPYEGVSAVLEVTPDFGCVLWEQRE